MASRTVAVILVAHASGRWLREALESVSRQTYRPLDVVVACVGEVDVPGDVTPGGASTVTVAADAGFAQAVNAAAASVPEDDAYLLLLHDDVVLPPDAVERLVARADQDPQVAAVGAKLLEAGGRALQEVGGAIDRFGIRRSRIESEEVDHGQYDGTDDVVFASAACLLVRRGAFDRHKGLDPAAWPFYEDVDLCWRLRTAGERVVVAPQVAVSHAAALSRGLRPEAPGVADAAALQAQVDRGHLRFMLKNYQPLGLALLLPQYLALCLVRIVGGFVRRELWRVRSLGRAWLQVARELRAIRQIRAAGVDRVVDDQAILQLASKQAAPARRIARVATLGKAADMVQRAEQWTVAVAREPVTWAILLAVLIVAVTLRQVLLGGEFILGEVRALPSLGEALSVYTAGLRSHSPDPLAPTGPGLIVLGLLHSAPLVGSVAERLMLAGPLLVAGLGAARLGAVLGMQTRGRLWLALAAAVNPVTLFLLRDGWFGALVMWAASMWFAATFLQPRETGTIRVRSRWVVAWAVVVSLHPPSLVWLVALGAMMNAGRNWDDDTAARLRLIGLGAGGAFVLCLPWSLTWLAAGSPVVGRLPGFIPTDDTLLGAATFGAGWPLLAGVVLAVAVAGLVRAARLAAVLLALTGLVWIGGAVGAIPEQTALAAAGWCVVMLIAQAARGVHQEYGGYELGWRQGAVVVVAAGLGVVWLAGAVVAVIPGAQAHTGPVVSEDEDSDRILWLQPTSRGVLSWVTGDFANRSLQWPPSSGPGQRLVMETLATVREDGTHRGGALLALAGVSHIVALTPDAAAGLALQTDLVPDDVQGPITIFTNRAWGGAQLLAAAPEEVFTPDGLAALTSLSVPIRTVQDGARFRLDVPADAEGVVYVPQGARRGWTIAGVEGTAAAAGAWIPAEGVEGEVEAIAPRPWWRVLYVLQAALGLALVVAWSAAVYRARPAAGPRTEVLQMQTLPRTPVLMLSPVAVVVAGIWLAALVPAPAGAGFLSSAWYCPPVGEGPAQQLAVVNPSDQAVTYAVRPTILGEPVDGGTIEPHGRATVDVDPMLGAVVEGYGASLPAASVVSATDVSDTANCASSAPETSIFPEGGQGALQDPVRLRTTFVAHNPFPEVARLQIRLFMPDETIAPPAFQDIAVEPGETVVVDPETQLEPTAALGAEISVWRGRAIVARRLRRSGAVWWSLGAGATDQGIVPWAATQDARTRLIVINPSDQPSRVLLRMTGEAGTLPPVGLDVAAGGREAFDVGSEAPDEPDLFIRVNAEQPVGIESIVIPDTRAGISTLPLLSPEASWVVPAAEGRTLVLANPGTDPVTVHVDRLGPGPRIADQAIQPGMTVHLPLPGDDPFGLLVSTGAGRFVASVIGGAGASPGLAWTPR